MVKQSEAIQGTEKEFLNEFHKLCYSRSSWQVWADLMAAIACSISNIFFIRKADHPEKSYFTMEWRDNKIIQCRGFKNCGMPADVQAFVKVFEKKMNEAIQGDNTKNAERKAG